MTTIARVRRFASENSHLLAFCAGSVVTSGIIIYLNKDMTLLKLTKDQAALLKYGQGSIRYELKDQTLQLIDNSVLEAYKATLTN